MPLPSDSDLRHRVGEISMMISANSAANQRDLRQDLQEAHNHFRPRDNELYRMKITQSGNLPDVNPAPDDLGSTHPDIRELKHMHTTNQAPSPIDVTA
jgi:hypothetical protein